MYHVSRPCGLSNDEFTKVLRRFFRFFVIFACDLNIFNKLFIFKLLSHIRNMNIFYRFELKASNFFCFWGLQNFQEHRWVGGSVKLNLQVKKYRFDDLQEIIPAFVDKVMQFLMYLDSCFCNGKMRARNFEETRLASVSVLEVINTLHSIRAVMCKKSILVSISIWCRSSKNTGNPEIIIKLNLQVKKLRHSLWLLQQEKIIDVAYYQ